MKIAIISDIHEDLNSLELAFSLAKKEACNAIICLGDIVGFSAQHHNFPDSKNANACLDRIRTCCDIVIPGNHDLHAIKKVPGTTDSFYFPDNWYEISSEERAAKSNDMVWLYEDEVATEITAENKEWLLSLPSHHVLNAGDTNVFLSHYIYPNLQGSLREFYTRRNAFRQHRTLMEEHQCRLAFAGHTHHPGLLVASRRIKSIKPHRAYTPKQGDIIMVPPTVNTGNKRSICIFNSNTFTVEAKLL